MLEIPKLVQRLFQNEKTFLRVSPHFLFTVLLARVRRELEKEADDVIELAHISDPEIRPALCKRIADQQAGANELPQQEPPLNSSAAMIHQDSSELDASLDGCLLIAGNLHAPFF